MQILHFTDIHLDDFQINHLIETCYEIKPDAVAISGDLTSWESEHAKDIGRLKICRRILEDLNKMLPVIFSTGNHEQYSQENSCQDWDLFCSDNQTKMFEKSEEKILFTTIPYSDLETINKKLLDQEKQEFKKNPDAIRIWLHHDPPYQSGCAGDPKFQNGSRQLELVLQKNHPHFLLCGHIHSAPHTGAKIALTYCHKTICSNPGANHGENHTITAPYSIIDTTKLEANWIPASRQKRIP